MTSPLSILQKMSTQGFTGMYRKTKETKNVRKLEGHHGKELLRYEIQMTMVLVVETF